MQDSIVGTEKAGEQDVKEMKNEIAQLTKAVDKLEFENQELEEQVEDLKKEAKVQKEKVEAAELRRQS